MQRRHRTLTTLLALAGLLSATSALAERADRDKPVNVEADRITVDDVNKVHQFDGNVQMSQGTMLIRAEKVVVTQDAAGNQKGTANGGSNGLASFRQKREGREDYVEGEAERIVYDSSTEKTELYGRAMVISGQDRVRGEYIAYDGKTENYLVDGRRAGGTASSPSGSRVRAVIQPRAKQGDTGATTGARTSPPSR